MSNVVWYCTVSLNTSSHKTVGRYGWGGAARDGGHDGRHDDDDAAARCAGGEDGTVSRILKAWREKYFQRTFGNFKKYLPGQLKKTPKTTKRLFLNRSSMPHWSIYMKRTKTGITFMSLSVTNHDKYQGRKKKKKASFRLCPHQYVVVLKQIAFAVYACRSHYFRVSKQRNLSFLEIRENACFWKWQCRHPHSRLDWVSVTTYPSLILIWFFI